MKNLALLGFAALVLTGCPGPGGEGGDSARLVGTWDELPGFTGNEEEELGSVTFRADGTFEVVDEELVSGTFEADATTLTMTLDDGVINEVPYAVAGDLLTPMALRRVGGGSELAGEWRAEGSSDGEPQVIELVLESDNTFTLDLGEDLFTGTWRETAGSLITTLEFPDQNGEIVGFDLPWHSVGDAVSLIAYERR